jgi:hypothetical protein
VLSVDGCAAAAGTAFSPRYFIAFMHGLQHRPGAGKGTNLLLFGTFIPVAGIIQVGRRFLDRAGLTDDNTSYLLVAARPNAHFYFFVI